MSIINLLPDDYVQSRTRRRANTMCAILFAVVMSAVIGAAVVSKQSSQHTCLVRDQVNASYSEAAKLIDQMQQLQRQRASLIAKAERAAVLQERVPRSHILGILTNACPEGACLSAVSLNTRPADQGEQATKFNAMSTRRSGKGRALAVDLVITGYACTDVDVAKYIANLASNPLLTSVDLVYSEQCEAKKLAMRKFQIRLRVLPNVDVIDVIKPRRVGTPTEPRAVARLGGKR